MDRLLRWFALVTSLVAVALLLVLPIYVGVSEGQSVGGPTIRSDLTGTLVGVNGASVLFILAVPILAAVSALVPWPGRYRRALDILGATLVTLLSILGAFTIGMFFLPTAAALLVIALWPRGRHAAE